MANDKISESPFFSDLSAAELLFLEKFSNQRTYEAGDTIIAETEDNNAMRVLLDGSVTTGDETISAPHAFQALGMSAERVALLTLTAGNSGCELLELDKAGLRQLLTRVPGAVAKIMMRNNEQVAADIETLTEELKPAFS